MKITKSSFLIIFVMICVTLLFSTILSRKVKVKNSLARRNSSKAPLIGIPGVCIGAKGTMQQTNQPDSFIKNAYEAVKNNISAVLDNPNVCFGDFAGPNWDEENPDREEHLEDDLCLTMALDDSPTSNYSVFSFSVPHIPCGDSTDATVTACFMINDKACIGLAVNTEIAACLLSYIPDPYGITKIIGLLKDVVPQVVFVVCPERGIEEDFQIMLYDKKPVEHKVEIRGSIQFSLGLAVPGDWLKLTKIPGIDKLMEITGICTYIYDFGAKATDFIKLLKSKKMDTIDALVDLFEEAINKLNPSILFVCEGKVVFGISKLSLQMLPDLEITLAKCELLFNYQAKDKIPTGVHLSCQQDVLKDIEGFIKAIFEKFSLDKSVTLPSSKVSISVSISDKGLVFVIELSPHLHLVCFISNKGRIECNIGGVFFEMLMEGAKFLIREITKFMDKAIDKVEQGIETATEEVQNLAKKGYNVTAKLVGKIKNVVKQKVNKIANDVKDTAKNVAKDTKKTADKAVKEVKKTADKAVKEVKKVVDKGAKKLKSLAKSTGKAFKKAASSAKKTIKKIFSKW